MFLSASHYLLFRLPTMFYQNPHDLDLAYLSSFIFTLQELIHICVLTSLHQPYSTLPEEALSLHLTKQTWKLV